jgi:hypothetical protein
MYTLLFEENTLVPTYAVKAYRGSGSVCPRIFNIRAEWR